MKTDQQAAFKTVVSPFQIGMLVAIGELCGRAGHELSLEVLYNLPAAGSYVAQGAGWPAKGMPFELCVIARTNQLAVDVYPSAVVAYETVNEKYNTGSWQLRCEINEFESGDDMSKFIIGELKGQMRRLGWQPDGLT